jgi:3-hydroxyacyl-[acyl-carrier-protein] dehydratase
MSESGSSYAASGLQAMMPSTGRTLADQDLRDLLKRCPPETLTAALRYRRTKNPDCVPIVVAGVISRYLSREKAATFMAPRDEMRLVEDLGLDSLSLIEISMNLEDALAVTLSDEHLRQLKTLGDVKQLTCACLKV